MLNGGFYNSRDSELIEMYHRSRKLTKEYNQLDSDQAEKREQINSYERKKRKKSSILFHVSYSYIAHSERTFILILVPLSNDKAHEITANKK